MDVGISPDSRTGFTIGSDRNIIVWDLQTGQEIRRFGSDLIAGPDALSATFTPDGRYVLSNNGAKPRLNPDEIPILILWDVATGQPVRTFTGHSDGIGGVAVSPDGQRALSGEFTGALILWDMATGDVIQRFGEDSEAQLSMPCDLAFSPDGRRAYVKRMDGLLVVWDLETFTVIQHLSYTWEGNLWRGPNWRSVLTVAG